MSQYGMLIDYEYCTGCYSCEVACRNEKKFPLDQWGIKITEVGPFEYEDRKWEWQYVPVPTVLCDLCEDRRARGKKPACQLHCQALCMEIAPLEDLVKIMSEKGKKVTLFLP